MAIIRKQEQPTRVSMLEYILSHTLLPSFPSNYVGRLGYCGLDLVLPGFQTLDTLRFSAERSTAIDPGRFTATYVHPSVKQHLMKCPGYLMFVCSSVG